MAFSLSPGDVVLVSAYCSDGEQVSINSYFYLCGIESGGSATDSNFSLQWDAAVGTLYPAAIMNTAQYLGSITQKVFPLPAKRRITNVDNTAIGTAGAIGLPRQAAGLISWATEGAGPAARGRTYLPFPSSSDNELEGEPKDAYRTKAAAIGQAAFDFAIVNGGGGGDAIAVTLSLCNRTTFACTKITDFAIHKKWATIKRRGSYGKANISPF